MAAAPYSFLGARRPGFKAAARKKGPAGCMTVLGPDFIRGIWRSWVRRIVGRDLPISGFFGLVVLGFFDLGPLAVRHDPRRPLQAGRALVIVPGLPDGTSDTHELLAYCIVDFQGPIMPIASSLDNNGQLHAAVYTTELALLRALGAADPVTIAKMASEPSSLAFRLRKRASAPVACCHPGSVLDDAAGGRIQIYAISVPACLLRPIRQGKRIVPTGPWSRPAFHFHARRSCRSPRAPLAPTTPTSPAGASLRQPRDHREASGESRLLLFCPLRPRASIFVARLAGRHASLMTRACALKKS